jgi:hypothetical protein
MAKVLFEALLSSGLSGGQIFSGFLPVLLSQQLDL